MISTIMRYIIILIFSIIIPSAYGQTDAYIKLHDEKGKHPRIESITYPGDADLLDMYNSIYGHGAVIENPWVAYRVYMDNRQSLDLYVKQTPRLELDVTGFYTTPGQLTEGYGCDVLWAGKSIAAGSFRGFQDGRPVTIDSVATRTQTVTSDHEIKVVNRDWIFNGHPIQMTQTYSVKPDSRDLTVEVKLNGYAPDDLFCTGIQKLETDNKGFISPRGVAGSWGSNIPDKAYPESVETVGLGILVDPDNVAGILEDPLNYLILVKPDSEGIIRYRVLGCGSRENYGYSSAEQWFGFIRSK